MIKEREEREKIKAREIIEEGRLIKQKNDDWYKRMEKIKKEKIQGLKDMNVNPKYMVDLERYKIV